MTVSTQKNLNQMIKQERTIIYEDESIRVIFQPGTSEDILITFGDRLTLADGMNFFADRTLEKLQISSIGFVAKNPNWFPAESVNLAHKCIQPILADYSETILYGGSMGAYASIKYSSLFKASGVIAFCPQWSIDPTECNGTSSGFERFYKDSMKGMGIHLKDMAGKVCIFHDPKYTIDNFHFSQIKRLGYKIQSINVYMANHDVTPILAGTLLFGSILQLFKNGNFIELQHLIDKSRRKSHHRIKNLVLRLINRRMHIAESILQSDRLIEKFDDELKEKLNTKLLEAAIRKQNFNMARVAAKRLGEITDQYRAALILKHINALEHTQTTTTNRLIATHHNTFLVYNPINRTIQHEQKENTLKNGCSPLFLLNENNQMFVCTLISNTYVRCYIDPNWKVSLSGLSSREDGLLEAHPAGDSHFHLISNSRYLSARKNGTCSFNVAFAKTWETFQRR